MDDPATSDPEVPERSPGRRRFSAKYKMKILTEYDALEDTTAKGALLRREGLYSSNISTWRHQRDHRGDQALARPAGRQKGDPSVQARPGPRRSVDGLEAKRVLHGTGTDRSDPRRLEHPDMAFAQRFVVIDNEDDLAVLGYERRWVHEGGIPSQAALTASISTLGATGFFRYLKTLCPRLCRRSESKS